MFTKLDTTYWNVQDVTGNQGFVHVGNDLYVVTNSRSDNSFSVLHSADGGYNFTEIYNHPFTVVTKEFDPVMCVDPSSNIWFLGSVATDTGFDLNLYKITTLTNEVADPITLHQSSLIHSAYDILSIPAGGFVVGASILTDTGTSLTIYDLSSVGDVTNTHVLKHSDPKVGDTFGSISLLLKDVSQVEVYYTAHKKVINFKSKIFTIATNSRSLGGWGSEIVLYTYIGEYTDDKLTAYANGGSRYLTQSYYTKKGVGVKYLIGNAIIGSRSTEMTDWVFVNLKGNDTQSYVEPLLHISSDTGDVVFSCINRVFKDHQKSGALKISRLLLTEDGINLIDVTGFFTTHKYTWTRGARVPLPTGVQWEIVGGEIKEGKNFPSLISSVNVPPVIVLNVTDFTLNRGTPFVIDASQTYDADNDLLSFIWTLTDTTGLVELTPSTDGRYATVLVPKSIGPAVHTVVVHLSVSDHDSENTVLHTVTSDCTITVPFNASPTIHFTDAVVNAARNSEVTITPLVVDIDDTVLTFTWSQVSGTVVALEGGVHLNKLVLHTNGVSLEGETLVFQLEVSDGVNSPVTASVSVIVESYLYQSLTTPALYRALWSGTLSQRNVSQSWSADLTQYQIAVAHAHRGTTLDGANRYTLVSPELVTVIDDNAGTFWKEYYPPIVDQDSPVKVIDAYHTENDRTIILTDNGKLYQYTTHTGVKSDNPDSVIDIASISMTHIFDALYSTVSVADKRVLFLTGESGCLIVQVANSTFALQSYLFLSASNYLYGGGRVHWIRTSGVESTSQGKLLIGTVSTSGNTYATLMDLNTRSIVSVYDQYTLKNNFVTTGEVLFDYSDAYIGRPTAPVLDVPAQSGLQVHLVWAQERPDLVISYEIEQALDTGGGITFYPCTIINSGMVREADIPVLLGSSYQYRVRATSPDGISPYSNIVLIIT